MTLAGDAHILLDDDKLVIDRSVRDHYSHNFTEVTAERLDITGYPGKQQLLPDTMMWTYDDWGGGESQGRNYYPDQPDKYLVGYEINPRLRGQLTGRPARTRVTLTTSDRSMRPVMGIGDGVLWCGNDDRVHYTTDGTTWTSVSAADTGLSALDAAYYITSMTGDHEFMYFAGYHSSGTDERAVMRIGGTASTDTGSLVLAEISAEPTYPFAGMCMLNGKLYGWTGRKLMEHDDPGGTVPIAADASRKVFDTGTDPTNKNAFSGAWFADCFAGDNSVFMYYSTNSKSQMYEYKRGAGRPFWTAPTGFTIKSACFAGGVVYAFGRWGGDSNDSGAGAIYAIPLDSLRPIFVGFVRKQVDQFVQMQECASSYGSQVLFSGSWGGNIMMYDLDQDAITMLDKLADSTTDSLDYDGHPAERVGALCTYGTGRYVVTYSPDGAGNADLQVLRYLEDEPTYREDGLNATGYSGALCYFESLRWDYAFPMEMKSLIGFHLAFQPLVANQTLAVHYSIDENTWVELADVTSATSGASVGRVFIPVSIAGANVKFYNLKFRVELMSTSTVQTPILFAVTAEAKLVRKREEWELIVRVKDEASKNSRPSDRRVVGHRIRDWIEATVEAGNVVTFRDGYRYKTGPARYTTHNVVIKEFRDMIDKPGEGTGYLKLVAVTEAT